MAADIGGTTAAGPAAGIFSNCTREPRLAVRGAEKLPVCMRMEAEAVMRDGVAAAAAAGESVCAEAESAAGTAGNGLSGARSASTSR